MNVLITFSSIGIDAGPFNLYSDVDGYVSPFELGVTRQQLLDGFPSTNIPDGTTVIRAKSTGVCTNSVDLIVHSTACFNFLPENTSYILSQINNTTHMFAYGAFSGYEQAGVPTTSTDLVKLNADLTLDTSFNVGIGFNEILYGGSIIIQQPDGKIIVTGTFTSYQGVSANRIIRLNTNGTKDITFDIGTGFNNFTQVAAFTTSGTHVLVTGIFANYKGVACNRLARISLADGSLDTTLVVGSSFPSTTLSVIPNSDGSMIITHYNSVYKGAPSGNGISKLDSIGTLDTAFRTAVGTGFFPFGNNNPNYAVRIPGDTGIYVSGYFTSFNSQPEGHIIKLNADGTKDTSFVAGTGFNAIVGLPHIVWGDKIFIQGSSITEYNGISVSQFVILNADGTLLYTPTIEYTNPIFIGDNLYAKEEIGCLKLIFTKP